MAAGALATAALTAGTALPANAAPVGVTTTVTDSAGNPVEGFVSAYLGQADGSYTYSEGQYLADGRMNLPLEPGTYKFEFQSVDGTLAPEFYVDKPDLASADPIAVTGPTALAPVALAAAPTATGRVINAAGRPVRGGSVELHAGGSFVSSARIERDGTFTVGAPLAGSYKLFVDADGYAEEWYTDKTTEETADAITLGAAPLALGDIGVVRGGVMTGRLTNTDGTPLERVQVRAVGTGNTFNQYTDYTDASGVFRIDRAATGVYKVEFRDPVGQFLGEWFADKPDQASATELVVNPGATVAGIDAALANDPSFAVDPATIDLSGTVTDSSGAPVIGASVVAYDTPATAGAQQSYEFAVTNRAGQYAFTDLDPASSGSSENQFKISVSDELPDEDGQFAREARWYGGAQSYAAATPAPVPAAGVNVVLPLAGGISGTVSTDSSISLDGVSVRLVDAQDGPVSTGGTVIGIEDDGTYSAQYLKPGTYKVLFADANFDKVFGPQWYRNTNYATAKTVKVTSGKTATGIDAELEEGMRALRAPEIKGNPYLGGKIRATPGTWVLDGGTTYQYAWLVDDQVVGQGRTLKVSKKYKGDRITLQVTASNNGTTGTALATTQKIAKKPKVKISVKGSTATVKVSDKKVKAKKFTGKVVVRKIVRTDEFGAPVYKKVGQAKIVNGQARLTVKKLVKGKNKLVFSIDLKGKKYGDAEIAKTVKVKKKG
ncbi:carboxypeptidase regulatory-like domain-containing protein [Nocardioides sp. J2M5]|uniref:carboxypeptidase-like regulatory domain-containing protein n=1 Tax=Nocardioides palaemonis TaxID=2829810 RepID=UPI001BAADD29|nr:carboxypeptidase-like regulatory domain-containing protein [Nocardioides palaemonis]MBS2936398.1 carboxypeptidase regulatory-like domain-containing protein [Nocardioides palaemonis]